jgi:outer membrane lipoprotein SlyB
MADTKVREAVGVFHDEPALQAAVDELLDAGFEQADLSLLAGHQTIERKLGHYYEKVAEIEDDPGVPRRAFVDIDTRTEAKGSVIGGLAYVGAVAAAGMIVASGGTIAAALIAATLAGGAGGVVGAAFARFLDQRHARHLHEQLDRGGILLWVRAADDGREARACEILKRHSADDVHVHELPAIDTSLEGGVSRDMSFMKRLGL